MDRLARLPERFMSLCSADVEDEVVTYVQVEIAQSYAFVWFPLVLIGFGILVIQADLPVPT